MKTLLGFEMILNFKFSRDGCGVGLKLGMERWYAVKEEIISLPC